MSARLVLEVSCATYLAVVLLESAELLEVKALASPLASRPLNSAARSALVQTQWSESKLMLDSSCDIVDRASYKEQKCLGIWLY